MISTVSPSRNEYDDPNIMVYVSAADQTHSYPVPINTRVDNGNNNAQLSIIQTNIS